MDLIMDIDAFRAAVNEISKSRRKKIFTKCRKMAQEEELKIGDVQIPFFTLPFFISSSKVCALLSKLEVFLQTLIRLEKYAYSTSGHHLFERLMASLTPGGRHLVEQCSFESDYSLLRRHRRIDGFFNPATGSYQIVEVNQAAPLALHYYDVGQRIATTVLDELGFAHRPLLLAPHLLEWLVGEYGHRHGGDIPSTIALVIEHGYPPKFTDLPRISRACEKIAREKYGQEIKIIKCFPYEIRLSSGDIFCGDLKIDMIWRNSVYMTSYREHGLNIQDYEHICSHPDKYVIVNSTRSWLTRSKEVFSIIWDDDEIRNLELTEQERSIVRDLVPLTFNLKRKPEVMEQLLDERKQWVSKPADSGFGKGVEFGEAHSQESWKNLLRQRAHDGFVFQKKIDYPDGLLIDIDDDGGLSERTIEFDFCPHHLCGRYTGGALMRAAIMKRQGSCTSLMNLASGGLLLPLVVT